jgi:hypothetical protein
MSHFSERRYTWGGHPIEPRSCRRLNGMVARRRLEADLMASPALALRSDRLLAEVYAVSYPTVNRARRKLECEGSIPVILVRICRDGTVRRLPAQTIAVPSNKPSSKRADGMAARRRLEQALIDNPDLAFRADSLLALDFGISVLTAHRARRKLELAGSIPVTLARICRDGSGRLVRTGPQVKRA